MCLYPRLLPNPKYRKNKKNQGFIPPAWDHRVKYVPVGCGNCIECRKQKASEWRIRLSEELKVHPALFLTLTIDVENCTNFVAIVGDDANAVATYAIRKFHERIRKNLGHSLPHWFVPELGHTNTERVHLHGLLFYSGISRERAENIVRNYWNFGFVYIGEYCNEKSINYMTKYILKIDSDHPGFVGRVLSSPGIGKVYLNKDNIRFHEFKGRRDTKDYYVNSKGYRMRLPMYYRNYIYSERERERLWIGKLDKDERYILGQKISRFEQNQNEYFDRLKTAQQLNRDCGFGDCSDKWKKRTYAAQILDLQENNV